jgi:hypothetical protein
MESEQGSRLPKDEKKKRTASSRRWRYIKAEARLPEVIKERVMMATTRGAKEANDYRCSSL